MPRNRIQYLNAYDFNIPATLELNIVVRLFLC